MGLVNVGLTKIYILEPRFILRLRFSSLKSFVISPISQQKHRHFMIPLWFRDSKILAFILLAHSFMILVKISMNAKSEKAHKMKNDLKQLGIFNTPFSNA